MTHASAIIRGRGYKEMDHLAEDVGPTATGGIDGDFGGVDLPRNSECTAIILG